MEIRYVLYGKMKNILKTALCTFWHDMYKKWIKKQIEDSHEKKWHCNSSTCFQSVFTSPFQFHIHPYAPKREKKNYWQRMGLRKNGLPNRIQTHCPPEHWFGTLHYPGCGTNSKF